MQDNSKMDNKYLDQAIKAIQCLLKSSFFKTEKENYLTLCFENFKRGFSVPQSLQVALNIISSYSAGIMFYNKEPNGKKIR